MKPRTYAKHQIQVYYYRETLVEPAYFLHGQFETFGSWKQALQSIYGEGTWNAAAYETLEESKLCKILRYRSRLNKEWKHLYFVVDTATCTVEQAIGSTKIGSVIFTHSS